MAQANKEKKGLEREVLNPFVWLSLLHEWQQDSYSICDRNHRIVWPFEICLSNACLAPNEEEKKISQREQLPAFLPFVLFAPMCHNAIVYDAKCRKGSTGWSFLRFKAKHMSFVLPQTAPASSALFTTFHYVWHACSSCHPAEQVLDVSIKMLVFISCLGFVD